MKKWIHHYRMGKLDKIAILDGIRKLLCKSIDHVVTVKCSRLNISIK